MSLWWFGLVWFVVSLIFVSVDVWVIALEQAILRGFGPERQYINILNKLLNK